MAVSWKLSIQYFWDFDFFCKRQDWKGGDADAIAYNESLDGVQPVFAHADDSKAQLG